jgi:cytosine/uracil/thiamine/allantoin permease
MPFLMVIHILESTFFLNFLSFISSTLGAFLGIISIAGWRTKKKRQDDEKWK